MGRKIETDFLKWLKIGVIWGDDLRPEEKVSITLLNLLGEIPEDQEKWLEAIAWFYRCGKEKSGVQSLERLLDWKRDGSEIWADFRVYAGIDLDNTKLHWWEFMALFGSLPKESAIKRIMSIRAIDLSKIKDPKIREEYAEQKRAVALDEISDFDFME